MAVLARLDRSERPENLKRCLVEEAEEYRRRHPVPPLAEVIDEIIQDGTFRPVDFGAPDSLTLLRESRGYEEPARRSALNCSPEELMETSWGWAPDSSLAQTAGAAFPPELRQQLVEEAEEYRRRHPVPPLKELVEEIIQAGTFRSADFGAPDCVELIREDRDR